MVSNDKYATLFEEIIGYRTEIELYSSTNCQIMVWRDKAYAHSKIQSNYIWIYGSKKIVQTFKSATFE